MDNPNDNSPRAKMWKGYGIALVISSILHMPFFPLQFMTAFGGADELFIIFTFYDFIYWVASFALFNEFAGLGSPQFIIWLIWGVIGFIVDIHNGFYIMSKCYWNKGFFSSPTWKMSSFLLTLGFLLALIREFVFLSGILVFQIPKYNPRISENQALLRTGPQSDAQNPAPEPFNPQPWPNYQPQAYNPQQFPNQQPWPSQSNSSRYLQPSVPVQEGIPMVFPSDTVPSAAWPASNAKSEELRYDPSQPVSSGSQNNK